MKVCREFIRNNEWSASGRQGDLRRDFPNFAFGEFVSGGNIYKKCSRCGKENFEEMEKCWNCETDLSMVKIERVKKIKLNPPVDPERNIDSLKKQ